jgi:hypothetical protein
MVKRVHKGVNSLLEIAEQKIENSSFDQLVLVLNTYFYTINDELLNRIVLMHGETVLKVFVELSEQLSFQFFKLFNIIFLWLGAINKGEYVIVFFSLRFLFLA